MRPRLPILAAAFLLPLALAQSPRTMSFDDLVGLARLSDPQPSPDGASVAYTVTRYSKERNSGDSDVWIVPMAGGAPRQLTRGEKRDNGPAWSPDGSKIAFISSRDGTPQVWIVDAAGGEPRKLTSLAAGADGVIWSPDGGRLAFVSEVYPDCADEACNRRRYEAAEASKVKARIIDRLLFRHWDSWKEGRRSHIFTVAAAGGAPVDVTPGDHDAPVFSLGGPRDYDFSPDGKELAFARNTEALEAASTNVDLWTVASAGGRPRRITTNPAYDGSPRYSPDGKMIAYRVQRRAGFEADRFELVLVDRASAKIRSLTPKLDRSVGSFDWAPDSRAIYFGAEDEGRTSIYRVSLDGAEPRRIVSDATSDDVRASRDGRSLVFVRHSLKRPVEIYRSETDGTRAAALTTTNDAALARLHLGEVESVRYPGAAGASIQAWIVRPPGFASARRYPAILLVHGGPQGAWEDAWSYRWNPQMFAARGYVVFAPNPRGSTGFGQQFTDEISGDWGGRVFQDVMAGVDAMAALPYVDSARLAAAGASYGGYMVNWLAGHTDRFRALVSHAGVYDLVSMYGATEELWFPEWEFRGPPWTNRELYEKWSPSNFAASFKTPMLVTHGELDFRVPVTQGLELFTALQRRGVPSRLLYFPDEGHWVLKPLNSELWYRTVLDWIDKYTK